MTNLRGELARKLPVLAPQTLPPLAITWYYPLKSSPLPVTPW